MVKDLARLVKLKVITLDSIKDEDLKQQVKEYLGL